MIVETETMIKPVQYMQELVRKTQGDKKAIAELLYHALQEYSEVAQHIMTKVGEEKYTKTACNKCADYVLSQIYGDDSQEIVGTNQMTDAECEKFDYITTPNLREERKRHEDHIVKLKEEMNVFIASDESDANVERLRRVVRIEDAEAEINQINQVLTFRKTNIQ